MYWTDWQSRSIERVNKHTGKNRKVITEQLPDLMGLKAVSVHIPEGNITNISSSSAGARYSSVVRALAHGAMGRRIDH